MSSVHAVGGSRSGSASYGAGRFASAAFQVVVTAAVTRVLSTGDLGRFAAAFSVASLTGIFFSSSVRRLAMFRDEHADLADLKISSLVGGVCGALGAAAICLMTVDVRTAEMAALLAGLRGADGYAEIAQAAWCQLGRFSSAARALVVRTGGTTAVIVAVLLVSHRIVTALAVGLLLRAACAAIETRIARRQHFSWPAASAILSTFALGSWVSMASGAILLVDTLPTLLVARFGGLAAAAILAPLGRIRFAAVLVGTTLVEIYYPEMARRANAGERLTPAPLRALAQYVVPMLVVAPIAVFGGAELVFGSRLGTHEDLVALALASGLAMGICNLVSAGLTAQARISIQLTAYSAAGLLAVVLVSLSGWSVASMMVGQIVGCGAALAILIVFGYRERPRPLGRIAGRPQARTDAVVAVQQAPPHG